MDLDTPYKLSSIKQIISLEIPNVTKQDIKHLLRVVLNYNQAKLIISQDYILTNEQLQLFYSYLTKLTNGIPLAYITGVKEFYSLEFIVTKDTLIPRPETEHIVDYILEYNIHKASYTVLDLGTGSGCIAISLKYNQPNLILTAVDVSLDALNIAKQNALKHNTPMEFIHSNWFNNIHNKFNIIVSNPPYIAIDDEHLIMLQAEPLIALSDMANGIKHYQTIIYTAKDYLMPDGLLILEHGHTQANAIYNLLKQSGYNSIESHLDYAGRQRYITAKV